MSKFSKIKNYFLLKITKSSYLISLLLVVFCLNSINSVAQDFVLESAPGFLIICDSSEHHLDVRTNFRLMYFEGELLEKSANFEVSYISVPITAQKAIQTAIDTWASLVISAVPIRVQVTWGGASGRSLAAAGATKIFRNSKGFSFQNTWYPVSLAEAILGRELNDNDTDIEVKINPAINWRTDNSKPVKANEYDLETVILHEIAHALGISSSFDIADDTKFGSWGGSSSKNELKSYYIYDFFIENNFQKQLVNEANFKNESDVLKTALTGNTLGFSLKKGLLEGSNIKLFSPTTYIRGTSFSHFDETTYPTGTLNSLMTPSFSNQEVMNKPGPLLLNCLLNLGWKINSNIGAEVVKEFRFYPNPVFDVLKVALVNSIPPRIVNLEIFNAMGQSVFLANQSSSNPFFEIDMSSFIGGLYILKVQDGSLNFVKRIVK